MRRRQRNKIRKVLQRLHGHISNVCVVVVTWDKKEGGWGGYSVDEGRNGRGEKKIGILVVRSLWRGS